MLGSTASRLSDRLSEAGLITRSVAPNNRRATLLELTDAGRGVLAELLALRISALKAVVEEISEEDRAALVRAPAPSPQRTNDDIKPTGARHEQHVTASLGEGQSRYATICLRPGAAEPSDLHCW